MSRLIAWQRVDTLGLELAEFHLGRLTFEGEVIVIEGGMPLGVSYRVECDNRCTTRSVFIRLRHRGAERTCTLRKSDQGVWTQNDIPLPRVQGLQDVDLSITPSTNTPPIRRLALRPGESSEVTAAWVRFPELDVIPLRQVYRRLSDARYEYEAPALNFKTLLECDDDGVIQTYHGLWKTVAFP